MNADSVAAVRASHWGDRFLKPLYDSYCFSQIPGLVHSLLWNDADPGRMELLLGDLAGRYSRVILFFVDAFGWHFLERYADRYPFLRRILQDGVATMITSQFPSTTAAHTTTVHTGLPVGQSGVYEWFYYEPQLDAVIAPLFFSFAGERERNTLRRIGVEPAMLFPRDTVYNTLGEQGIDSFVFMSQAYTPSPFSEVMCDGAHVVPFDTIRHALTDLLDIAAADSGRGYYMLYFDGIDVAGHHHGLGSPQFQAEVESCMSALESVFHRAAVGTLRDTLVLLTADHGQVQVDPAGTIYLNQTLPQTKRWVKTSRRGAPLVPAGSARDLFLHVRPECLDEARAALQDHLVGRAEVHLVRDLIAQGFFGPGPPSPTFLGRVGDLVVLPYEGEAIWWYEPGRFVQQFFGLHGGLTPAEMETILLALPYG